MLSTPIRILNMLRSNVSFPFIHLSYYGERKLWTEFNEQQPTNIIKMTSHLNEIIDFCPCEHVSSPMQILGVIEICKFLPMFPIVPACNIYQ